MSLLIFYVLAAAILVCAVGVVTLKNIMHSAISLISCLFLIAALYLMLDADFIAAVQVMLYVGGVTVLILFVVMLTFRIAAPGKNSQQAGQSNEQALFAAVVSAGLFAALAWMILQTPAWHDFIKPDPQAAGGTTAAIGNMLLSEALLPFEVASLLLLAAMVGAIVLSRGKEAG